MGHHRILPAYQPLIRSLSERLVRVPLGAWERTLAGLLRTALTRSPIDWDALASIFNQLAVIQAYRGHNDRALAFCEAQIGLWKALADEAGHEHRQVLLIQPWVNIIRLERWQKKIDSAIELYQELAPQNRGRPGTVNARYGVDASLETLLQLPGGDTLRQVLDNVYWVEYTRWLLATGQTAELQSLIKAGLGSGLNAYAHTVLLETLVIYQVQIGAFNAAGQLLARLRPLYHDSHRLPFAVIELYLCYSRGSGHEAALAAVCELTQSERYLQRDKFGLSLLCDIALALHTLGAPVDAEIGLLEQAWPLAVAIDEEVSLFDIHARLSELGRRPPGQWDERFRRSDYALVRKHLGLAPVPVAPEPDMLAAAQRLSRLDVVGCLDVLDAFLA